MRNEIMKNKFKTLNELIMIVNDHKKDGKRIIFTNGCFDIIHVGHLRLLKEAKKKGDILIVGLNSDESIKKIKGEKRPVNDINMRAEFLAYIDDVNYITILDSHSPKEMIERIVPDVLVKGKGYKPEKLSSREFVLANGGEVVCFDFGYDISTSQLIEKIKKSDV